MIRAEGLSIAFGPKVVLDELSITVEPGTATVVMGRSGIGKSVLLKCLSGLLKPQEGVISIDGEPIIGVSRAERERITSKIGMLFQEGALFDSMTVYENIAFPLVYHRRYTRTEIDRRVRRYAEIVEMGRYLSLYPRELSGGMKRKVALARAELLEPAYLFYDEPTTGLDPESAGIVEIMIRKLQDELSITSLVITHDIELARFVGTHIALLEQGRIMAFQEKALAFAEDSEIWQNFLSCRDKMHQEHGLR